MKSQIDTVKELERIGVTGLMMSYAVPSKFAKLPGRKQEMLGNPIVPHSDVLDIGLFTSITLFRFFGSHRNEYLIPVHEHLGELDKCISFEALLDVIKRFGNVRRIRDDCKRLLQLLRLDWSMPQPPLSMLQPPQRIVLVQIYENDPLKVSGTWHKYLDNINWTSVFEKLDDISYGTIEKIRLFNEGRTLASPHFVNSTELIEWLLDQRK